MYKVLIVEDTQECADVLRNHLAHYSDETGEQFQVTWLATAFDFVDSKQTYDLIFMDIGLPGINGMEAAQQLREHDTQTQLIFVTDLAQYAVKGYTVDALDFIVKPVAYYDFALRMERAMRVLRRNAGRSVYIPTKDGVRIMPLSQVVAIEINRHNLIYHLEGEAEPFVFRGSLNKVEEDLAGTSFVRISNSCIVNMDYVRRISGSEVRMASDEVYYISRTKRKEALAAIARYYGGNE